MTPTTTPRYLEDRIAMYEATRRKGIDFLLRHCHNDGSVGPGAKRVTYYRVPWALLLGGETAAACRLLAWIERHGLGLDGEFHGGVPWSSATNPALNTYRETCLAYGAQLLRRFDLARRAMAFALQFQDPETGGVYMDRERTGADGPQLLFPTCQFGMSALITGHIDAALAAGHWLQRLWDAQPDLPRRLYTVWTRGGGLATAPPAEDDARHYINKSQEMLELHYNGGIAAAFLAQLFMGTGDQAWLDLARAYQHFSMHSTERQFETKQVCKSAWGAGLLWLATRDPVYAAWTVRM
ncbi:MAG: hypothetical protein ACRDJ9_33015, partial [Dehalococcoidia bacterium]